MLENNNLTVKLLPKDEWDIILKLKVSTAQTGFIESSEKCLNDAVKNAYGMTWNFYGVYIEDRIIGFAMHGKQDFRFLPYEQVWLDRFMIDENYQGKGYGKTAMMLIIDKMYLDYHCKKIFLSVIEDNIQAISLYKKLGFKKTWSKDPNGERIMIRTK